MSLIFTKLHTFQEKCVYVFVPEMIFISTTNSRWFCKIFKTFSLQNIKISKSFKGGISVNCGVRNFLNFTPPSNYILRANDPFDKYSDDITENPYGYEFDPTYIYSSFQGITFFGGVSYEFNKKK